MWSLRIDETHFPTRQHQARRSFKSFFLIIKVGGRRRKKIFVVLFSSSFFIGHLPSFWPFSKEEKKCQKRGKRNRVGLLWWFLIIKFVFPLACRDPFNVVWPGMLIAHCSVLRYLINRNSVDNSLEIDMEIAELHLHVSIVIDFNRFLFLPFTIFTHFHVCQGMVVW